MKLVEVKEEETKEQEGQILKSTKVMRLFVPFFPSLAINSRFLPLLKKYIDDKRAKIRHGEAYR